MQQRALAFVVFFLAALPLAARADGVEPFYGSFGTEVPIDVPEFHALEPRLKLSYGSSGGDGFVGVGWSLSGLSIIERVGPRQSTPTYGASDGFVLDGQELVADASLGGTHSTRIQSYQRVRRDAAADRWYVWQKDGTRATYAPLYGTGLGTFRWAVVAIDDTRGNNVSYGWWCDPGNDCYPDHLRHRRWARHHQLPAALDRRHHRRQPRAHLSPRLRHQRRHPPHDPGQRAAVRPRRRCRR